MGSFLCRQGTSFQYQYCYLDLVIWYYLAAQPIIFKEWGGSYFVIFRNSFSLTTWHDILRSTLTRSNQYYLPVFAWHQFDNNVISKHITFDKMLFSEFYFWTRRVASGDTFPFLHRQLGAGCDWELELKSWENQKIPFPLQLSIAECASTGNVN